MKVYLAGPMRGIDKFNFPAFLEAAEVLRSYNIEVASPAEHDIEMGFDFENAETWDGLDLKTSLTWDFEQVMNCDAVVVLPGYENSKGVAAELAVARAVATPTYLYDPDGGGLYPWKPLPTPPEQVRSAQKAQEGALLREISPGKYASVDTTKGEVRVTDPDTGASKGSKLARFDLLPWRALYRLAEHYGEGAKKYEDRNWEKGYAWSLSIAALGRHLASWLSGETTDEETGHSHMVAVAWHALALMTFEETHPEKDDRVSYAR